MGPAIPRGTTLPRNCAVFGVTPLRGASFSNWFKAAAMVSDLAVQLEDVQVGNPAGNPPWVGSLGWGFSGGNHG